MAAIPMYSPTRFFSQPWEKHQKHLRLLFNEIGLYLNLNENTRTAFELSLATVAANMMGRSDPTWLMLIGPPSCGKTVVVESLELIKGVIREVEITNSSAFLSATSEKDKSDDATGGILRKIYTHGMLIVDDYTSISEMKGGRKEDIENVFRQLYSGYYTRSAGAEGGRQLGWSGYLGMIVGMTPKIDQELNYQGQVGPRWAFFRYKAGMDYDKTRAALRQDGSEWKLTLKMIVREFFDGLRIGFERPPREKPEQWQMKGFDKDPLALWESWTDAREHKLSMLAEICTRARTPINRDNYTKEINAEVSIEASARLAKMLKAIGTGAYRIGIHEERMWELVNLVATDSIPWLRRRILELLATDRKKGRRGKLMEAIHIGDRMMDIALHDLEVLGLVESRKVGREKEVWLKETEDRAMWVRIMFGENGV